ncbi:MAG: glycosyltransferase family 9 protein [Candidatus Omnitrophica bacterium]|nr:glycosyltransferase family 9 protein [Candidatus Omnitrophota bacterium]
MSRHRPGSPRLLFVRTDRLGETILNLPTVHALREAMPGAHLRFMVGSSVSELLAQCPDVNEVVVEPAHRGRWWQRAYQLSRMWHAWRPDTVIISNPKKEYHVAAWLARIPRRVGYDCKWGRLLTDHLPDRKALGDRHEVEYNLELLRPLGVPVPSVPVFRFPVSVDQRADILGVLKAWKIQETDCLVAVHPWTSAPHKQWPVERFRQLIEGLRARRGLVIVVIGGAEEQHQASKLLGASESNVIDAVGRLSLPQLAALFSYVRVLISNDSGPVHLAAAVGTPTVVLFRAGPPATGPVRPATGPVRWGPWGGGHTVIEKRLDEIAVEEVLESVTRYVTGDAVRCRIAGHE